MLSAKKYTNQEIFDKLPLTEIQRQELYNELIEEYNQTPLLEMTSEVEITSLTRSDTVTKEPTNASPESCLVVSEC
jgi:hypothetical protein